MNEVYTHAIVEIPFLPEQEDFFRRELIIDLAELIERAEDNGETRIEVHDCRDSSIIGNCPLSITHEHWIAFVSVS